MNMQVKLYYYSGMHGRRWRLEGPEYSFWAPDDVISRDDLKHDIYGVKETGNSDYGADSPCGELTDITGWWTISRPVESEFDPNNDALARWRVTMSGRNWTAIRWNTERLNYQSHAETGEFYCDNAKATADKQWETRRYNIHVASTQGAKFKIVGIQSKHLITVETNSGTVSAKRIYSNGMYYAHDDHESQDGTRAKGNRN